MFRHVVMMKWVEGTDAAAVATVHERLSAMPSEVSSIRGYAFGDDAALAADNWDFAVVADFDDEAGYVEYRDAPAHQAVIRDAIRPILASRAAVQFVVAN